MRATRVALVLVALVRSSSAPKARPETPAEKAAFRAHEGIGDSLEVKAPSGENVIHAHLATAYAHIPAALAAEGLYMEFGVRTGSTINFQARRHPDRTFHGFDGFQGLPDAGGGGGSNESWAPGMYSTKGVIPKVEKNVVLVVGWFDKTLPDFLKNHTDRKVAMMHIDSDVYSSAYIAMDGVFGACMHQVGTVIAFDEFYGYREVLLDEYRALKHATGKYGIKWKYITYHDKPSSRVARLAVQITGRGEWCCTDRVWCD